MAGWTGLAVRSCGSVADVSLAREYIAAMAPCVYVGAAGGNCLAGWRGPPLLGSCIVAAFAVIRWCRSERQRRQALWVIPLETI